MWWWRWLQNLHQKSINSGCDCWDNGWKNKSKYLSIPSRRIGCVKVRFRPTYHVKYSVCLRDLPKLSTWTPLEARLRNQERMTNCSSEILCYLEWDTSLNWWSLLLLPLLSSWCLSALSCGQVFVLVLVVILVFLMLIHYTYYQPSKFPISYQHFKRLT